MELKFGVVAAESHPKHVVKASGSQTGDPPPPPKIKQKYFLFFTST